MKAFQAPAGETLNPTGDLTAEGEMVTLGELRAVRTSRFETPDFSTSAANELFTKADLKRVVASYEIGGGEEAYRLDIVVDLYRPKSGSGSSWLVRKTELFAGSPGRRVLLDYSHLPGGEVLAKVNLGAPITVKLYYNGIPKSGGWTDVFNSPTALLVDGDPGRTYLNVVGIPQLLEPEGQSPAGPSTQAALLIGYLLLESERWTIGDWEWSVR